MKKVLSLLLALVMVFSLAACSSGNDNPGGGNTNPPGGNDNPGGGEGGLINFDEDPYEVAIQLVGLFEENRDIADVEAALNKITLEKINCTVDIVPIFIGDLPTTTSLNVATGEKQDVVVAGLTSTMISLVADDCLLPLDDLLAERGQAAVAATKNVVEASKINGVTYAVSGYPYAALAAGFVYNKTMADEYGIDMHDFMTIDDLSAVGEKLKEHNVYLTTHGNSSQVQYKFYYGGDYFGSNAEFGGILDPANSTTIENVYGTQAMRDFWKTVKSWTDAGYLPPDQLTDTTTTQEYFASQKIFGTASSFDPGQLASWINPNFEAAVVQISDPIISTGSAAEFQLAISAKCARPDKAMDLINLIYSDPDVVNLLMYGVEGQHYVAVEGTENVITRAGTANEDGNGYSTVFSRFGSQMDRKVLAPMTDDYYDELETFEASAKKSLSFGYSFSGDGYSAQTGAIASVLAERLPALNAGKVDDVDKAVDDLVAALERAGINDTIAASQAALNAYLGQ